MTILLETKAITKSYHGNIAVDAVDFDLCAGEVHALLGENGAGKSTLSKLLAGVVEPTSGALILMVRKYGSHVLQMPCSMASLWYFRKQVSSLDDSCAKPLSW